MGPDTDTSRRTPTTATPPTTAGRCPTCRASVRPDTPWCTQCWTDLRPPPPVLPAMPAVTDGRSRPPGRHAGPVLAGDLPSPDGPVSVDRPDGTARGWPCSACGATNPIELSACAGCGLDFLAVLRADAEPLLVLPGVGDVGRLSRAQRLGLSGGVVLFVVLLTLMVGLLFG